MRVYIVEDNAMLQHRLEEAFSGIPGVHVVGHAADARTAIEDIARLSPDLVTLDLWLRTDSGFEVLRSVQSWSAAAKPDVFVLTSHTDSVHRDEATRLGAARYFDKAQDMPALMELMTKRASARAGPDR